MKEELWECQLRAKCRMFKGRPTHSSQASFKGSPLLRRAGRPLGLLLCCIPKGSRCWEELESWPRK